MRRPGHRLASIVALVTFASAAAAGCSGAGLGDAVRKDITTQMQTTQPSLATCYRERLQKNRRLAGRIVVHVVAEPETGVFTEVKIIRDEIGDPGLLDCVMAEVKQLKLAAPQKTQVAFEYPFEFAPTN